MNDKQGDSKSLPEKPPETLQKLKWLWNNGRRHWKWVLAGAVVLVAPVLWKIAIKTLLSDDGLTISMRRIESLRIVDPRLDTTPGGARHKSMLRARVVVLTSNQGDHAQHIVSGRIIVLHNGSLVGEGPLLPHHLGDQESVIPAGDSREIVVTFDVRKIGALLPENWNTSDSDERVAIMTRRLLGSELRVELRVVDAARLDAPPRKYEKVFVGSDLTNQLVVAGR